MRRAHGEGRTSSQRPPLLPHLDHRHAVRGLGLAHLLRAPGLHAVGVQQPVVGVLVVHHQQPGVRAVLREVVDAVVVHAHLRFLFGRAVGRVGLERRVLARQADRVAPRRDHLCRSSPRAR